MCKESLNNDRSIGQFCSEHIDLSYAFTCNPDSCGNPEHFQEYLMYYALSDAKTGKGITYVITLNENERPVKILGFVTLKATSLITSGEDGTMEGNPAIEISELAIADGFERQGIGRQLFEFALLVTTKIRKSIGVRYILVCSEPKSVGFYEKMNLKRISEMYIVPREMWNDTCIPMYVRLPEE